tara:strand:- start:83 stop:706 length:624 start_codon:yes stop_codon:yes gene_type:complete
MIHICDNFFSDPYTVRNIALHEKYMTERFNYPGVRSYGVPESVKNNLFSKVKNITQNSNLKIGSTTFQSIKKEFGTGIYHKDHENYICIIYLSLDPPVNSGTEICDFGVEGEVVTHYNALKEWPTSLDYERTYEIQLSYFKDPFNLIKRYRYARVRRKLNSYFTPTAIVANKFNRGLIFPCKNYHRSQNFFGSSIENSRLTIVSFMY